MSQDFKNKCFLFFEQCFVVKGYLRSVIVDSQRETYIFIPEELLNVLLRLKELTINEVLFEYGKENKKTITDFLDYLIKIEFGFIIEKNLINNFINIDKKIYTPSIIENCIIEYFDGIEKLKKIIFEVENLFCKYLEIVIYEYITNDEIYNLLKIFNSSNINFISLSVKYDKTKEINNLKKYSSQFLRLDKFRVFNSKENNYWCSENFCEFVYLKDELIDFKACGVIEINRFKLNLNHLLESNNHNTCLHKKLSIDKEGNIKNCPAMPQSFGNIIDTTLEEAISHPDFKKYWNVTKDMIQICKDCEFRHICTDCRAYTERTHFEKDIDLSKPLKCGYNPYTNEWADWSTNPLKQKAIEYYGMQELVKKYTCNKS